MTRPLGATLVLLTACNGVGASPTAHHDAGTATLGDAHVLADAAPHAVDANIPVDAFHATCSAVALTAMDVHRPVDVIVLPDESSSMGSARNAVVAAMQGPFVTTMEAAGIDYHVIWTGTLLPHIEADRLCSIPFPGGSGDMFDGFLQHIDVCRDHLRAGSVKVFVQFTDARSGNGSTAPHYGVPFDQALVMVAPDLFHITPAYDFTFDTFIGLPANTPATAPYDATHRVVSGSCSSHYDNSTPLQQLSIRSGGYRFPLCDTGDFDSVFQLIADSAVSRAAVPCELTLPPPPAGSTLDTSTIAVRYTSGATTTVLRQTASSSCDASSFTLTPLPTGGETVTLCDAACTVVTADPMAALNVVSGCDPALY